MKRAALVLLVLGFLVSVAGADYVDPPGWENDPYFTHQSWDFLSDAHIAPPDGQPAAVTPDYPSAKVNSNATWTTAYGSGDGGWLFDYPVELTPIGPLVSLYIPNVADPNRTKEIWVQVSLEGSFELDSSANVAFLGVVPNESTWENWTYITPHEVSSDYFDVEHNRLRVTARIDIRPQPQYELIYISLGVPYGEHIFIDEIDVDTRCVPEPSALAAILAGGLLALCLAIGKKAR